MARGSGMRPADAVRRDPGSARAVGWVGLIGNPHSGRGRCREIAQALDQELTRRGLSTRYAWSPEQRRAMAAEAGAEPGCRGLVAIGGDGTVADLINERPEVPVAVLPSGTENLFARHFGFERRASQLADRIERGLSRRVDLGRADGRFFALMAGFGFDAEVVSRHHLMRMGRRRAAATTSRAAYVEPVLRSSFNYRFPPLTVHAETEAGVETLVATTVIVFNLPCYALGLPFVPDARDDDGWLDLVVFSKPGPFHALRYLWLVFRGLHLRSRGVEHRRVRRVSVEAAGTVPVQLDGDPAGNVESGPEGAWTIEVVPLAVEILT